jgi:DNA adenine methylase
MNLLTPTRPAARWHGGKWILAPWIISVFPAHRVYVEPFGGAASVLIRKPRAYAEVYNDLDGEVVNLFRVMQSEPEALVWLLKVTPFARDEFLLAYEASDDPVERARRLVIRSFMGFGSNGHTRRTGFRSNSNRSGTTPARDWRNYPECLEAIVERFRGVVIENKDALSILATHDSPHTLFYFDPPYVAETRDSGPDYTHEMDGDGHTALLIQLRTLRGMVVLSGYPHLSYDDALPDWRRIERPSLADGARPRTEVLWINPACAEALNREKPNLFYMPMAQVSGVDNDAAT